MTDVRDGMIHQAQEARAAKDTLILQKVNASQREAFIQKFPGQTEHILRLIAERLQAGLRKDIENPLSNSEVESLANAMLAVYDIHRELDKG